MKKSILVLCAVAIGFLAISFENPENDYPSYLSEELVTIFESEYLETIEDSSLNILLENNFPPLFDKVEYVNAQKNKDGEYYYIVFAEKNGKKIINLLKVNESDVKNKTYSYINFSKINAKSAVYCAYANENATGGSIPPCPSECDYHSTMCIGIICGVYQGGQCIQE